MAHRDPLALLREHGANATSFQLLEPGIEHWFSEEHDAFVGYADTGKAWVVLGEPVAAAGDRAAVRGEFTKAAKRAGRRLRHFAIEEPIDGDGVANHAIGEQPEWTRGAWRETLAAKRSLREQLRRARAKGVTIEEREASEAREELEELAWAWRETRTMATMHFAVHLDLFHHASERRYFVASVDGEAVGALVAVPIYARDGWLIEDLLRSPKAPNGTSELLFDAAIGALEASGAKMVSMGLAPLSKVNSRALTLVRATTSWLFDWRGLRAFKAKLGPSGWRPIYAAWPTRGTGVVASVVALGDILRSFAGGSLAGFGARTAIHRYRAVLFLLAILLVPWIGALTTSGAARYFPTADLQAGWVAFDILLFAGLVMLSRDYQRSLALLLLLGAGLDFAIGCWQLATWNAARAEGLDWLLVAFALLAPLVAFGFLSAVVRSRALRAPVAGREEDG